MRRGRLLLLDADRFGYIEIVMWGRDGEKVSEREGREREREKLTIVVAVQRRPDLRRHVQ